MAVSPEPPVAPRVHPSLIQRVVALLEVLLCSDYPTQAALGATFTALGYGPYAANGDLRVGFVVTLSLVDTAMLVGLMLFFLYAHGERPRDVFLGARPVAREASFGLPLIFVALAIAVAILATIQRYAPSLHTVEHNPLQALIRQPSDVWLFAIVVVIAGGVREELQRAFLLRRFEVWLGGATVGVVIASIAFGAGHLLQGADAAIATGTLGAFWGIVYLRRGSVAAPVVSHSGFNLLQIVQFLATRR
ncbi:MAG TPA: CPBP family intramembrane glutamic endopeptidase [Solirubrobacteraceae bacterium]|nr:CPBP family intramembrane glutamic endopeptidase [Solirubrobacteraceae bacterium]